MPIKSLIADKLAVTRPEASPSSSRPPPSSSEAAVLVVVSERAAPASPLPAEVCAATRARRRAEAFADAERVGLVSAPDDSVPAGWLPDARVRGGYSAGPQADGWAPARLADGSVPLAEWDDSAALPADDSPLLERLGVDSALADWALDLLVG